MPRGYMHSVWSLSFQIWSKPEIRVIAFQLIPGDYMFGRQPSIFGHFFLWAGDRMRDLPGAWYRIRWQKIQLSDCALIWDGFMIASLTTASFVIPKKTWLWLHRQIRDVHRDSAIDNFVEVCYLSWLYWYNHTHCLRLIPTRAHIPTPEMQNSTLNKIWCRCFTTGMWWRVWGTVVMRLLADPSVSPWLTWSKILFSSRK